MGRSATFLCCQIKIRPPAGQELEAVKATSHGGDMRQGHSILIHRCYQPPSKSLVARAQQPPDLGGVSRPDRIEELALW